MFTVVAGKFRLHGENRQVKPSRTSCCMAIMLKTSHGRNVELCQLESDLKSLQRAWGHEGGQCGEGVVVKPPKHG